MTLLYEEYTMPTCIVTKRKPWTGTISQYKQDVQKRAPKFQHTDSMRQRAHRPSGMLEIQTVVDGDVKRPHEKVHCEKQNIRRRGVLVETHFFRCQ